MRDLIASLLIRPYNETEGCESKPPRFDEHLDGIVERFQSASSKLRAFWDEHAYTGETACVDAISPEDYTRCGLGSNDMEVLMSWDDMMPNSDVFDLIADILRTAAKPRRYDILKAVDGGYKDQVITDVFVGGTHYIALISGGTSSGGMEWDGEGFNLIEKMLCLGLREIFRFEEVE